jgi:uncharacterized membrane protein
LLLGKKIIALILGLKVYQVRVEESLAFYLIFSFLRFIQMKLKTEKYFEQDKIAVFSEKLEVLLLDYVLRIR